MQAVSLIAFMHFLLSFFDGNVVWQAEIARTLAPWLSRNGLTPWPDKYFSLSKTSSICRAVSGWQIVKKKSTLLILFSDSRLFF